MSTARTRNGEPVHDMGHQGARKTGSHGVPGKRVDGRGAVAVACGVCRVVPHGRADGAQSGHARETAKRHARTSLRLPDELQKIENEGGLHPGPEWSLQIALFAANHYDWDGSEENRDEVTRMAQSSSKGMQRHGLFQKHGLLRDH